ncbi:MAG: penicillin-binding protein 2 [Candidatus Dormiibacterota bacterium]
MAVRHQVTHRFSSRRAPTPSPRRELPRFRLFWLIGVVILVATVIWGHLAYWQVGEHTFLAAAANQQHVKDVELLATRGVIYDRTGRPLALDTTVYDVALSPPQQLSTADKEQAANGLASVLHLQPDQVLHIYRSHAKFAYVARRISQTAANQIKALSLANDGVTLQAQPQRTYLPGGETGDSLGAGFLGFVNYAGQGGAGVEGYYQSQLGGRNGSESLYQDSSGNLLPVTTIERQNPVEGQSMSLTIDSDLQYQTEQIIQQAVQQNKAESGSALIMDTHTGGIVAWATAPSYNANNFATTPGAQLTDPIANSLYEPGSVMKVVTLSGALNAGAITPQTQINDPGYIDVSGTTLHDWNNAGWGNITYTRVLEESLNVGAVHAQEAEGQQNYLHYLQAFGFGQPTQVGVAGEQNAPLPAKWNPVQLATAAYGQGIQVNMVQMLAAVNTIANNGEYVSPHLMQSVGGQAYQGTSRQVITPQTATEMKAMMRSVDQYGEGRLAQIPGFRYDESGKTGTSQIPINGSYSDTQFWSSFVGFLPSQNPQFTLLVVLRKPNNGSINADMGDTAAAPIWKQIAEQAILRDRITAENLAKEPT